MNDAEQSERGKRPARNDRQVAVAEHSTERRNLHRLLDLDDSLLTQIEAFVETCDRLGGEM